MRSCGGSAWAKACSASSCGAGRTFSPWPRLAGAASAGPEAGGGAGGAGGAPNRSSCKGKAVNNGGRGGDARACLRSLRGRAAVLAGWYARRGVHPIAWLLASAATPQTTRQDHCPKGWSEIGRLDAPAACMGNSPCGASEASTHPDCAPTRPLLDRKQALTPAPHTAAEPVTRRWQMLVGATAGKSAGLHVHAALQCRLVQPSGALHP